MTKRQFTMNGKRYLHFPIRNTNELLAYNDDKEYRYVDVFINGERANTFYLKLASKGEKIDFYAPYYLFEEADEVTLVCEDCEDDNGLFEQVLVGDGAENMPALYPPFDGEKYRPTFHFSSRVGWLNDPNGLFYKDGVFHMYYQHNPFGLLHGSVNISWGHATSTDGVHWVEKHDAIYPVHRDCSVASGTAFIDVNNLAGFGENAIFSLHTELATVNFGGEDKHQTRGQYVCLSNDNGDTFVALSKDANVPVPIGEYWRDPKIFEADGKLCLAVYERFEEKNCISFYSSDNMLDWKRESRIMDMYECPDIFQLKAIETGTIKWVLYAGDGKYRIGRFENYMFIEEDGGGYLDYGICYAGQTFTNYPSLDFRFHLAWIDSDNWSNNDPFYYTGKRFSQCMALLCKLQLHETTDGRFYITRTPVEECKNLRESKILEESFLINGEKEIAIGNSKEIELTIEANKSFTLEIGRAKLNFDIEKGVVSTPKGEVIIDKSVTISAFIDKTSVEIFLNDKISITYTFDTSNCYLKVEGEHVAMEMVVYELKSIW